MNERGRDKGDRAVLNQANTHSATADINNLSGEFGICCCFVTQEASIQPVADIAFCHAVQTAALCHLHGDVILWTIRRFTFDNRFQQTMVDHIAIFTNR
ncbi:hypothetical protein D3C75_1247620 [compost metagenome]